MDDYRDESAERLANVRDSAVERAVTSANPEAALVLAGMLETARLRGARLGPVTLPIMTMLVTALGSDTSRIQPRLTGPDGRRTHEPFHDPLLVGAAVAAREFDLTTADAAALAECPPDLVCQYKTRLEKHPDSRNRT